MPSGFGKPGLVARTFTRCGERPNRLAMSTAMTSSVRESTCTLANVSGGVALNQCAWAALAARVLHAMQSTRMPSRAHPNSDEPRTDRPRTNGDPAEVARKLALLDKPHVKPLSDFVRHLRDERGGDESIPWFDPTEAGTEARILMLLEAPGRKATSAQGSGFISPTTTTAARRTCGTSCARPE